MLDKIVQIAPCNVAMIANYKDDEFEDVIYRSLKQQGKP